MPGVPTWPGQVCARHRSTPWRAVCVRAIQTVRAGIVASSAFNTYELRKMSTDEVIVSFPFFSLGLESSPAPSLPVLGKCSAMELHPQSPFPLTFTHR